MERVIVDGMNVLGVRPDGWWRDRDAAVARLVDRLGRWASSSATPAVAVFDGDRPPGPAVPAREGLEVVFAGRGSSADDEIVRRVHAAADPGSIVVVTSDAGLARRVREAGAGGVVGAGGFRAEIEGERKGRGR